MLASIVRPGMGYGMALVNLSKGQQMAMDKARYQILRKALSVPVAAGGSAILKVLGVPPMSFRASKLNACFMARVYDAGPDTLTAKILSYATKGWVPANIADHIPATVDKGDAGPYGERGEKARIECLEDP